MTTDPNPIKTYIDSLTVYGPQPKKHPDDPRPTPPPQQPKPGPRPTLRGTSTALLFAAFIASDFGIARLAHPRHPALIYAAVALALAGITCALVDLARTWRRTAPASRPRPRPGPDSPPAMNNRERSIAAYLQTKNLWN